MNDRVWFITQAETHERRARRLRQHYGVGASDIAQDSEAAWADAEALYCRRRAIGEQRVSDPKWLAPGVAAYTLDRLEAVRRQKRLPKTATVAEIVAAEVTSGNLD